MESQKIEVYLVSKSIYWTFSTILDLQSKNIRVFCLISTFQQEIGKTIVWLGHSEIRSFLSLFPLTLRHKIIWKYYIGVNVLSTSSHFFVFMKYLREPKSSKWFTIRTSEILFVRLKFRRVMLKFVTIMFKLEKGFNSVQILNLIVPSAKVNAL